MAKKPRLDEGENGQPPTADAASFEAQAAATKKASIKTIGTVTPVDDFKILIEQNPASVFELGKQLSLLILQFVNNSHGDALFEKAIDCLQCLRQTCIQKLEPKLFNDLEQIGRAHV